MRTIKGNVEIQGFVGKAEGREAVEGCRWGQRGVITGELQQVKLEQT